MSSAPHDYETGPPSGKVPSALPGLHIVKHSWTTKILPFLLLFIPALALIAAGGYFFATSEIRYQQQQLQANDAATVDIAATALKQNLHNLSAEIKFLGNMPRFRELLDNPTPENLARTAEYFRIYMESHGIFNQIRWIDQSGNERVRVDFVDGHAQVLPSQALQDKSKREYYLQASRAPVGAIFVSPLELNIEHEEIERPFKPVIRMAMPVADSLDRRQGVIIINYCGQCLLDAFELAVGDKSDRLLLLNRDGYWLRGLSREVEWGFMLNQPTSLANLDPALWAAISRNVSGGKITSQGLWSWNRINPLQDVQTGLFKTTTPTQIVGYYDYIWHVVMFQPSEILTDMNRRVWRKIMPPMAILAMLFAVLSGALARSHIKIKRLNLDLAERASEAQAANKAKSHFLANMSHEIRTPMNAILGLAYLLEQAHLTDDTMELVRKIRVAGRSLLGIINDILDFSKIEAGRLEIEHAPFRLSDVLDNLAAIMSTNAGDKDIEVVINPPPILIDQLYGDALRLEQVLINLTGNAIKFTDEGHVDLSVDKIDEDERQVTLRFAVRDTGIGITAEKQAEIFAPFNQADISTTRRFGGTGLGLTISRWLIEKMGGEMGVISVFGSGSEFWFTLALDKAEGNAISAPQMSRLDVLIADDNPIARNALSNSANALGWNAYAVNSGEAALHHLLTRATTSANSSQRQIILLDWKMPGMDGLSTARAIRESVKKSDDPIIIMVTAYSREQLLALPDSKLADAVLSKPVTTSGLYNAVSQILAARNGGEPASTVPASRGKRLAQIRMLVVDDSDINREVAQRIFAAEGALVSLANDGRQALDWLQTHLGQVDVVLMDVQMPIMDGYEATRRIRRDPNLAKLPVIAVTAGAFKSQEEAALDAGMDDFIPKPFDVESAIALILKLTERRNAIERANPSGDNGAPANLPKSNTPDLNVEQGLALWQDPTVYRQYLRKFAHDYADSVAEMAKLDRAAAAALAHKLKGAAGAVALSKLAELAGEADRVLNTGEDTEDIVNRLQSALDSALAAIADYAPPEEPADNPIENIDTVVLTDLLIRTLKAFDTDNHLSVLPLLAELDKLLPAASLAPLHSAVENFDFRGGEAATQALAAQFNIVLED